MRTLFPYTTLFRSDTNLTVNAGSSLSLSGSATTGAGVADNANLILAGGTAMLHATLS
jgi:hypothetical protein